MSVWGGLLSPVPMSTAGDALGIWLDKRHPWWLLPSFQDAFLSPTLLAWILLLLNLLLSAHDNMVTRATYKATQLLSFSPWPWHTSLYLQYPQPPSDLLYREPDPLGFELSILKYIHIYMLMFDRDLSIFLWNSIIVFTVVFVLFCFYLPNPLFPHPQKSWQRRTKLCGDAVSEQHRSRHRRGRAAGWLWQSTHSYCPQLARVAGTFEMKAQQVSEGFPCGSCWTYKLGPQHNLISWNVKWLILAACSIGVFLTNTLYSHFLQKIPISAWWVLNKRNQ